MMLEPYVFSIIAGTIAIVATFAGLMGYRSYRAQEKKAQQTLAGLIGDFDLASRFEEANATVLDIQDGIRHGRLSEKDRVEIFRKLQQVEQTYSDVVRHRDANAA
jgi:hypothetical protein